MDLDDNQEVVRAVSGSTYQSGMSWLGRDSVVDPTSDKRDVEEELLAQAWDSWELDLEHWHSTDKLQNWADNVKEASMLTAPERLNFLEAYDDLAGDMSAADICSGGSFGTFKQVSTPLQCDSTSY